MKKVFKSLMVGALAIPCAFAFTGCGDNGVSVDTRGNYKPVESTVAYTEIDNLQNDNALDFEGIKFTLTQNVSGQGATADIKLDGTAIFKANNEVEFAFTVNVRSNAAGINVDSNMSLYMQDKVLYIQSGNMKFKVDTTTTTDPDLSDYSQYLEMVPTSESISHAIGSIQNYISVSEKSDEDGVVKYHLKGENDSDGTNEVWLVLKDGKFDGFKGTSNLTYEGTTLNGTVNVVAYTGAVEFPSFDGYVEM